MQKYFRRPNWYAFYVHLKQKCLMEEIFAIWTIQEAFISADKNSENRSEKKKNEKKRTPNGAPGIQIIQIRTATRNGFHFKEIQIDAKCVPILSCSVCTTKTRNKMNRPKKEKNENKMYRAKEGRERGGGERETVWVKLQCKIMSLNDCFRHRIIKTYSFQFEWPFLLPFHNAHKPTHTHIHTVCVVHFIVKYLRYVRLMCTRAAILVFCGFKWIGRRHHKQMLFSTKTMRSVKNAKTTAAHWIKFKDPNRKWNSEVRCANEIEIGRTRCEVKCKAK